MKEINNVKIMLGKKEKHLEFIQLQTSLLMPYATWYLQNFLQLFNTTTHLTLVCEQNNLPIAFCSFILAFPTADVDLTATKLEYQNKGYASLMFKKAIAWFKKKGFENLMLEVAQNNEIAQNFYEKLGFKKQKRIIKSYYNDGQDAFIYMLNLKGDF